MITIRSAPLGPEYRANCYLLGSLEQVLVVDPGDEAAAVIQAVQGRQVAGIVLTHCHCDHIGAALELREASGAPIAIGALDVAGVADPRISGFADEGRDYRILDVDRPLEDGDVIEWGEARLTALATPGHTPGSMCFLSEDQEFLLTGDTLFAQGVGRTDFLGGDAAQLQDSLRKIARLRDSIEVLPGHGGRTWIGMERARNPLLRV